MQHSCLAKVRAEDLQADGQALVGAGMLGRDGGEHLVGDEGPLGEPLAAVHDAMRHDAHFARAAAKTAAQFAIQNNAAANAGQAREQSDEYSRRPPPKTAGREQYGELYAKRLLAWGRKHRSKPENLIRTATLLTALSILDAFHRWILLRVQVHQLIVSGGGAHNPHAIKKALREYIKQLAALPRPPGSKSGGAV